jgi:predicted MFS family arabinose efflux permease
VQAATAVKIDSRALVFLLAAGISGWNFGNVGPVVGQLAAEFDVSLAGIGLLSTFLSVGIIGANLGASAVAPRVGVVAGIRAACVLAALGNGLLAVSPSFGLMDVGRVIVGVGVGLSLVYVPGFAREVGGVKLVGVFGAGLTLGIASALALGSVLDGADVDWRVTFAISALLAAAPLPMLPRREVPVKRTPHPEGVSIWREALTSLAWWRILIVGVAVLMIPFVLGAWLVHYLTADDGVAVGTAGAMSFGLFAIAAVMRDVSGRLDARGFSYRLQMIGGLTLGAVGLALLGQDRNLPASAGSIALIGVGLSLPYAIFYDEAERVLPDRPLGSLSLLMAMANLFPIIAVPLFGSALANGDAELAFAALAAVALLGALLNARPAIRTPSARPG